MENTHENQLETAANSDALGGASYSLNFLNNSQNAGSACLYQTDPSIYDPSMMSLAWLARFVPAKGAATFTWQQNYNFVCGRTGRLMPGVRFEASQALDADPSRMNQITLGYNGNDYQFSRQTGGGQPGSLSINEDGSIPYNANDVAVGFGMSGSGTFLQQARPNVRINYTPQPQYWIVFGNYEQGAVLDVNELTNTARIDFPTGVSSMKATLGPDNKWTISRS